MTIKTKRRICVTVGLATLLLMLFFVGGVDMGWMPTGRGIALAVLCEALGAAALWKAGWIRIG